MLGPQRWLELSWLGYLRCPMVCAAELSNAAQMSGHPRAFAGTAEDYPLVEERMPRGTYMQSALLLIYNI